MHSLIRLSRTLLHRPTQLFCRRRPQRLAVVMWLVLSFQPVLETRTRQPLWTRGHAFLNLDIQRRPLQVLLRPWRLTPLLRLPVWVSALQMTLILAVVGAPRVLGAVELPAAASQDLSKCESCSTRPSLEPARSMQLVSRVGARLGVLLVRRRLCRRRYSQSCSHRPL